MGPIERGRAGGHTEISVSRRARLRYLKPVTDEAGTEPHDHDLPMTDAGAHSWPQRPDNCPCDLAVTSTGHFYRLTDDDDPKDWGLPIQRYGQGWWEQLASEEARCRAHAFSIYNDMDELRGLRAKIPKFRGHRIVRFKMQPELGFVHPHKPGDPHHSWWPSDDFVPPVDPVEEVE